LQFIDHYEEAIADMLKKNSQARRASSAEHREPEGSAARSIAEEKRGSGAPKKKGRSRIEGQAEMLLPIAGKKG